MKRGGGIKRVGDLFETYRKRLRAPEGSVRDAFREVVKDVLGITLEKEAVSYRPSTRTITLRVPGMVRSEIVLRKAELLAHCAGRLTPESAPKEII